MNDVGELKEYIRVHARGQRISDYRQILDRIVSDDGRTPGSWVDEWCRAAETLEKQGRDLDATRYYAMARFPFVDGPARAEALERCTGAFQRWRSGRTDIESLDVDLEGGRVRVAAAGLSADDPRPLVVVMGGIVSVKEQWAPMLAQARRLGMAAVVTEMPSAGENTLRYDAKSWRMVSGLLDALAGRADVTRTHAIALSFSGHLALRCAMEDHRIRSVVTAGAPADRFFTDAEWRSRLPRLTLDTLAHLIGGTTDEVLADMGEWSLGADRLAALRIPVSLVASRRDEIIPYADVRLLREHVRDIDVLEFDDVHGAPRHVREAQLWTITSLLRSAGVRGPRTAVLGMLSHGLRLRREITGLRGRTR